MPAGDALPPTWPAQQQRQPVLAQHDGDVQGCHSGPQAHPLQYGEVGSMQAVAQRMALYSSEDPAIIVCAASTDAPSTPLLAAGIAGGPGDGC